MSYYRVRWSSGSSGSDTPAVFALLAIFAVLFLIGFVGMGALLSALAWFITPAWFGGMRLWQPFTFPLVHSDFMGLLVDALVLFFFGGSLERAWGAQRFLLFFFLSGIIAGTTVLVLSLLTGAGALFIGMVGIFVALVVAFAALDPYATVYLIIFPLQARWLAAFVAAYDLFSGYARYGGRLQALVTIVLVSLFAWAFTTRRWGLPTAGVRRPGPSLSDRLGQWRQRQRMRQWQRRASRAEKPKDLFRD